MNLEVQPSVLTLHVTEERTVFSLKSFSLIVCLCHVLPSRSSPTIRSEARALGMKDSVGHLDPTSRDHQAWRGDGVVYVRVGPSQKQQLVRTPARGRL